LGDERKGLVARNRCDCAGKICEKRIRSSGPPVEAELELTAAHQKVLILTVLMKSGPKRSFGTGNSGTAMLHKYSVPEPVLREVAY
jgi:hypothetical protein